ncbi:MAG: tetratricopeptide repeat protein [Gammaproteobacteria bacterium]|nr:tetratricopeptide repeat protein [Gammaproteobacteria bacterium]
MKDAGEGRPIVNSDQEVDPGALQAVRAAATAYARGEWTMAERLCRSVLAVRGDYFDALTLLGIILAQSGRANEAADLLRRAVAAKPDDAAAHGNYGNVLNELGRFEEALDSYERALQIKPDYAEAYSNRGNTLRELQRLDDALQSYERALQINPGYAVAHNNRGNALQQLKRCEEALDSYERALQINPRYAVAHNNRGNTLQQLKRCEEALDSFDRALRLKADFAEAYNNSGNVLRELRRFEEALERYEQALRIKSDYVEAYDNRGLTLQDLGRFEEALDSYARALQLRPDSPEACNHRGLTFQQLRRFEEALDSYARALRLKPDYVEAYNGRGVTLHELKRFEEALDSYARALSIDPDYLPAHYNRGNALRGLQRFDDSLDSYTRALEINPDFDWLFGTWLHAKMRLCEWGDLDSRIAELTAKITSGHKTCSPFALLSLVDSPSLQRQAAEIWVTNRCATGARLPAIAKRQRHEKIRVGYFSGDYRNHAVSMLTAEMFETHARSRFEVTAFSFGPDTQDAMRRRMEQAFDRFIDVRGRSDLEIVQLARTMEVDIAVDLTGFTEGSRPDLFALRAAPLQVSYLGYAGTMGTKSIDYIVADRTLIPADSRQHYAEKIVYLPNSYQVNDSKRQVSDKEFTRTDLGLPATGIVFCCFNNNYKITPATFDGWMRILGQVPGSVLWLTADNETAASNLRKEAESRGVSAGRLVFARRMASIAEHLARYRAADLFIDTLPYNAHTTASDALWAGLPVLTRPGESLAARVAASLLMTCGLPELVAMTQQEYEAKAISLATDPARLLEFKERLQRNRATTPLFDVARFTGHLEDAYIQIYERYLADLTPADIYVAR